MGKMLKLSFNNSKLRKLQEYLHLPKRSVGSFDLPAGYTCPMARECKSYSNRVTGKITDGKEMVFRCYAASTEAVFTQTRELRWHNFDLLHGLNTEEMATTINSSIPNNVKVLRVHSSGDFFSHEYFMAWVRVAEMRPEITFFGYSKVLDCVNAVKPKNFHLVYSFGGASDMQITNEPVVRVVKSIDDARSLPVVCQSNPADDYEFIVSGKSFAILIHGVQPAKKRGLTNKLSVV